MLRLHGYQPGAVVVSGDLVLSHKLDEHRARTATIFESSASGDHKFSNYHTILTVDGLQRTVLTVGESHVDPSRPTLQHRLCRGFMVDVTQDEAHSSRCAVRRARQSMSSIQQSLGLLMGSLGLTEDAAFAVLSRLSSHYEITVRDLARRFMAAAVASAADSPRELSQVLIDQATALAGDRVRTDNPGTA